MNWDKEKYRLIDLLAANVEDWWPIVDYIKKKYELKGELVGRGDFEEALDKELTEEQWATIKSTTDWRHGITEATKVASADVIKEIVKKLDWESK